MKNIFVAGIIVLGIIITFSLGFYLVFILPPSVITIEIHPMSYGAPICIVIFILWKLYLRKREMQLKSIMVTSENGEECLS